MFRFTIRDVLWLMVVVGMAIAWVLDHHHQVTRVRFYQTIERTARFHETKP